MVNNAMMAPNTTALATSPLDTAIAAPITSTKPQKIDPRITSRG
ncbi:MAG: hypothetical protein QOE17_1245 [Gaiellales bacterium]|nr:hypothetical protein [Gaiellales bacterium]